MSQERFRCQHCKLPLVIHESLEELSILQSNLLTLPRGNGGNSVDGDVVVGDEPIVPSDRMQMLSKMDSSKALMNIEATDSYVLLPSDSKISGTGRSSAISENVNTLDKINDILNLDTEIDYPICTFCADLIISEMKLYLDLTIREKNIYLRFLKKLSDQKGQKPEKTQEHVSEMDELKKHETELIQEYAKLEAEHDDLTKQLETLELENESLLEEGEQTWALKNLYELQLIDLQNEKDAIQAQNDFHLSQLEKLRKSNVYNDVFKVSHDGQFGTISGLRLGNLDSCKISWHEINAALGQLVLLLSTLINKLNIKITNYTLIPMASYSRIEKQVKDPNGTAKTVTLECFSSGDSSLQRLVNHYKFDGAMCAILDVVKQIEVHLKTLDNSVDLPYKMKNDTIGDLSIKLTSKVTSEEWTTACKYLLINTKWILAYSIAHQG